MTPLLLLQEEVHQGLGIPGIEGDVQQYAWLLQGLAVMSQADARDSILLFSRQVAGRIATGSMLGFAVVRLIGAIDDHLIETILAARTLALPEGMPARDLVVSMAFGVVLFTLVVQGLTLRPLIRRLGLTRAVA